MKKIWWLGIGALILVQPLFTFSQSASFEDRAREYIKSYSKLAVDEMRLYRIPASITLAQGIYETNAGASPLAIKANNHFGIKCHKDWQGATYIQDDETKNECFRAYKTAEESYRDHSLFLFQRERYKKLFRLDLTDYRGWAIGLKESGYATNPQYPDKLIGLVEKFGLDRFDRGEGLISDVDEGGPRNEPESAIVLRGYTVFAVGPGNRTVYLNNGLQFILVNKEDNLQSVASAFGVSAGRILRWNDLKKGSRLVSGQMVYLEPKKRKGASDVHHVKPGETLYTISQREGIQLKMLYKRNGFRQGQVPVTGQVLLLR